MSRKWHLFLAALAVGMMGAATTRAAIIVNDTWQDATRTDPASPTYSENGVDSDADGDIEAVWYRSGTGSSTTMSTGHMVNAAGAAGSMSLTTYFTPEASPVTLTNVGDNMTVTWVFTPTGVTTTSTGNQDMRLAVVDSTTRLAADGTPASATYTGYGAFFNMRAATLGNSSAFRIMEWAVPGANNLLSTAAAWTQDATYTAVVGTTPGYTSGTEYTFTMSFTKTASGVDIVQTMAGTGLGGTGSISASYSDATPQALTFDTFAMRPQTPELTATSFDSTRFQVTFTPAVPEPASLALTSFGAIAGLALRRRR